MVIIKRQIQALARKFGYRVVPYQRDAQSLRDWLFQQPIGTVVDVGASRGETSQEWLKQFPHAVVHSIEPLPFSFKSLQACADRSGGRLRTYNCAVGSRSGTVSFRMHPQHHTSSSLLARTSLATRLIPSTERETILDVQMTTLDNLFLNEAPAWKGEVLVKLDVQGVETNVIAGGARFLHHVKYFLTEIGLAAIYEGQSEFGDIHHQLSQAGFELKGFLEQYHAEDLTPIYADVLYVNKTL